MMVKTETVAQYQSPSVKTTEEQRPRFSHKPTQRLTNLAEVHSQALNTLTTPGFEAMVRISPSLSRSIAPNRVVLTQSSKNRVPPDYELTLTQCALRKLFENG